MRNPVCYGASVVLDYTVRPVSDLLPSGLNQGCNLLEIQNRGGDRIYWDWTDQPTIRSNSHWISAGETAAWRWEAADLAGDKRLLLQVGGSSPVRAYIMQGGKPVESDLPFYRPVMVRTVSVTTSIVSLASLLPSGIVPESARKLTLQNRDASNNAYWGYSASAPGSVNEMAVLATETEKEFNWESQHLAKLWVAGAASQKLHCTFEGLP